MQELGVETAIQGMKTEKTPKVGIFDEMINFLALGCGSHTNEYVNKP